MRQRTKINYLRNLQQALTGSHPTGASKRRAIALTHSALLGHLRSDHPLAFDWDDPEFTDARDYFLQENP